MSTHLVSDGARLLTACTGMAAIAIAAAGSACAQSYPERPVRLVVSFPQGGPNDILGRLVAGWLSQKLGQAVNVDNKPGQSGNIGTAEVVKAAPDGYTLLLVGPANAISGSLGRNLGFNFLADIAPVGGITREALVLVVNPSVAAKTPQELISLVKAQPGQFRLASTGNASSPHLSGELFRMMTGTDLKVIHYGGGGPALKAMIAGEADVMFEPMSAAIEPVRSGKLRALAISTLQRSAALPGIPALTEAVPGYDASAATGIGAPKGTPSAIIDTINAALNAGVADQAFRAKLLETGGEPLPGTPADFGRLMQAETEKWAKVVKFAMPAAK